MHLAAAPRQSAEHLRDEERQLQRLLGVQPRVARGLVAAAEVGVGDLLRAAEALGDVLAGHLDMDAAGMGAQRRVHLEEALYLVDDAVEVAGLVAGRGLDGVAVHRVALPDHLVAGGVDLLDDRRQHVAHLRAAHPADQREPARRRLRVEPLDVLDGLLGVVVGPILSPIGLASSSANAMCAPSSWRVRSPTHRKCADSVVELRLARGVESQHGPLVVEQQASWLA